MLKSGLFYERILSKHREVNAMRLIIIVVVLLSGCSAIPSQRLHDTRWSDRNLQIMVECGKRYPDDADYSECLIINNATI
ncbi:hypothetical protein D3C85_1383920 [compost metagenome]